MSRASRVANGVESDDLGNRQPTMEPLQSIAFWSQVVADFKEPAGVA